MESDKRIGIYQYSDYIVPGNAFEESTDDAALEVCFRQVAPWEKEDYPTIYRMSAVFSAERKGIQKESGGEIVQRCSEIRYRGKTEADSMVLWKRGQKLEEAPEEIERKAIAEYVRNGQIEEAVRECENLGWDSGGEIVKVYQEDSDISQEYSSGSSGESAVFPHDNETILIPQCEEP